MEQEIREEKSKYHKLSDKIKEKERDLQLKEENIHRIEAKCERMAEKDRNDIQDLQD